ncbi:alanyl-tRNA synthetase [Ignisphaera aggregans DSM 17230]|uniref:Alanine--tRNA ligase n=1 Tax=Ignisphaera aggregans (strain DSM 17230 / JCM 13409 / AQ1.S1) TaxID=583356 RepID=E0SP23_IGNAA|nr:alanyl-tRNA synthetase [Ignisphaera aggregans DSM 17230]
MSKPISESTYRVRLFNRGYGRRQCVKCKAFFWSIKDRDDCGDAPCRDYEFFDIPVKRSLSYREVRDLFLKFFERHGHEIIEPRPVVARWREDLYLTIASIVVFQPHVTSGLVPPPANPLVIAQPCIRLEDIDSVGYTLGRHMTNFIMGGHHAFNYPDKHIYWTDETVEYAREFFVEELGIPEEEITFKESWWEGGGNAGPCFEVAVGGLELATLVFMMYRVSEGGYEEIPLKIVDTGYGIERIAWFVQKTPTAFHAVYGSLLTDFHKKLNISEPDRDILYAVARRAARIDPSNYSSILAIYEDISRSMGVSVKEIEDQLKNIFDLYAILDHTKTIALMLSDGIVPSNSGEGYLARLVIRRSLRKLAKLNVDIDLSELVSMQLGYWGDMYPRMIRYRDTILEMVRLEEDKYRGVISKLSTIAPRYVNKSPSLDELVTLYDSQGIPPDLLAEELDKRFSYRINVPSNFYSIVASRHSRPKTVREYEKEELPRDVVERVSSFPETRRIFHEDPYRRVFRAKVLGVIGDRYIVLDATAFYPEGGGQLGDRGILRVNGKTINVVSTKKIGNVVVHVVDSVEGISSGMEVDGEVDWGIRYRRMRHHTATHILLGALRRVLGDHVWQAGAEKTEFKARLDVTHYKMPSEDEIRRIEYLANRVVDEAIDVKIHYLPRNEAEKIYGFTLYQGGVPMEPTIRVVEIPGWDAQACFGTHVRNTSEVGGIKIINIDRIADGVIRFEYVVATALADYARSFEDKLKSMAKSVGSSVDDIDKRIETLVKEMNNYRMLIKMYRNEYIDQLVKRAIETQDVYNDIKLYIARISINDRELIKEFLIKSTTQEPRLIATALLEEQGKTYIEISLGRIASQKIDAKQIVNELTRYIQTKAGGKKDHVTGTVEAPAEEVEKIIRIAIKNIIENK